MALREIQNYEYVINSIVEKIEKNNERIEGTKEKIKYALHEAAQARFNLLKNRPAISQIPNAETRQLVDEIDNTLQDIADTLWEILDWSL